MFIATLDVHKALTQRLTQKKIINWWNSPPFTKLKAIDVPGDGNCSLIQREALYKNLFTAEIAVNLTELHALDLKINLQSFAMSLEYMQTADLTQLQCQNTAAPKSRKRKLVRDNFLVVPPKSIIRTI